MPAFNNQAALNYNNQTTLSNIVTGNLVETLTISKDAVNDTYTPGETVTYVVNLSNAGAAPLTGLTLTDNLGAYAYGTQTLVPLTYVAGSAQLYVNGLRQADPVVNAGPPMTVTGLNIPAGANAQLIYQAEANRFAPLGTTGGVNNVATATGAGLTQPVTAAELLPADVGPVLNVTKALTPTTITPNEPLTYTFTIQNSGARETAVGDNLVLTDTFDPPVNITAVTLNGAPLTAGTDYTYDPGTGQFATAANRIQVPAATYTQDPATGAYTTTPGTAVLTVTGTI